MSPENAKLVNVAISLMILVYLLLVFQGKIVLKKRSDFLEKNKKWLTILGLIGLLYPLYEIVSVVLKWK
jgi:amino acid transporter